MESAGDGDELVPHEPLLPDPRERRVAFPRTVILDGKWAPWIEDLRRRGAWYANNAIEFSVWFRHFAEARQRLANRCNDEIAKRGLHEIIDLHVQHVGDGFSAARRDVEEQAKARLSRTEEQLRHSQKMDAIGQLAGSVAHDFNNLLTVIKTTACLLEDDLPGGTTRDDAAEIRRAAERGTTITRQLLTLSRHGIAAPRPTNLATLVDEIGPLLRRLVGDSIRLVVHHKSASALPNVVVDPGQFEQVLMNLAVNARDAMATGGTLTIETATTELDTTAATIRNVTPGRYITLSVTDVGTGMDHETQRRIFEPFFTTKTEGKGTGLGLSIVHGIVTQARGAIMVYSELGHGTTFRLYIPVATSINPRMTTSIPVIAPTTLPPITVLVVDDHGDIRAVAGRVLQKAGCHVIEAATAEQARRICLSHEREIDVILLDVVLSDGRGDKLAAQLQALRPQATTVLMSGYPAGALSTSGGTPPDLLLKPFSPAELRTAIARVVNVAEPAHSAKASTKPHVLLVDDDEQLRRVLERALDRAGFRVTATDDGTRALELLRGSSYDAILSDVQMPTLGGVELLREVRRVDLDVPVLLMSGAPSVESATRAVEFGAFRYLVKPFETPAVTALLWQATRAHALARLRREARVVSGFEAGAVDRAGLEVRFEQAIDQLWLAFQPIVRPNGEPFGSEALMRSTEPSMLSPDALLDAAHQLERLPSLGRRVRALAAAQPGEGVLFVNLHPAELLDFDLVDPQRPLTTLASRVVLEVTERAALASSTELTQRIARLRELGFRLAIDDIGAGYSGLGSFTEIVPEIVKIDMALVRDVHRSTLKQRTIAALCTLCHEVSSLVVAEGIETVDEQTCLVDLGCDLLQGYLIGRPEPRRS